MTSDVGYRFVLMAQCDKCRALIKRVGDIDPFHAQVSMAPLCYVCGAIHHGMNPRFTVHRMKQFRDTHRRWYQCWKPRYLRVYEKLDGGVLT